MTRRFLPGLLVALGLLALGLLVAFTVGRYPVKLAELIEVPVSRLTGRANGAAQQGAVPVIGFLNSASAESSAPFVVAFRAVGNVTGPGCGRPPPRVDVTHAE